MLFKSIFTFRLNLSLLSFLFDIAKELLWLNAYNDEKDIVNIDITKKTNNLY
jgi:hypothetical protein